MNEENVREESIIFHTEMRHGENVREELRGVRGVCCSVSVLAYTQLSCLYCPRKK